MTVVEIESVPGTADADAAPPERTGAPATREVRHEYTHTLPPLLSQLGVSLLVSTYQAGKVVAVGVAQGELTLSYHNFERAMGLAVKPGCVAVGARAQVWFLRAAPDLAARVEPAGRHDACFLTRSAHFTGEIQAHELAWARSRGQGSGVRSQEEEAKDELWVVNTAFGCLCTLDGQHSFVPRWRPNKAASGCLIDVASGQTVARGFAMPHSPRVHRGRVWMLHSGAGRLVLVDPASGKADTVTELPGYTRGLALYDRFAFVGLSKIRETATFGGMPIAARRPELKCGVGVVDLGTGRLIGHLEFMTGVEEIFDVQLLPGLRFPEVIGFQKDTVQHTFVIPLSVYKKRA